ncbi:MAG: ABC transporter permease [Lachnospiraceae bacterium]|nr:ABC transporter permease [Lachnospiraceae bacterium]
MFSIFKKEVYRIFSDKKMIFSLFVLPLIIMVGMFGLMGMLMGNMVSEVEVHVATVYVQNAPEEVKAIINESGYLNVAEVTYLAADASAEEIADIRATILAGEADLLITFDTEFMALAAAYKEAGDAIPQVTVGYNSSRNYSSAAASNFDNMVLAPLETGLLQNRFGNLDLLTVFNTNSDLIIDEEKAGGQFLAMMLPYMMVIMLFASAMSVCIDAIAGEKERGTMASMLLSPVKRSSIVYGKLFALSLLSMLSAMVYAGSAIFGMPLMTKGMGAEANALPMNLSLTIPQAIQLIVLMITLVLLFVAVICLLSVFAKTVKEASSYVMPLQMVVMVVGFMIMLSNNDNPERTTYAIPVYGTAVAVQRIVTSQISMLEFGLSAASNLLCTIVIVLAISKVFKNEKVMLNA